MSHVVLLSYKLVLTISACFLQLLRLARDHHIAAATIAVHLGESHSGISKYTSKN